MAKGGSRPGTGGERPGAGRPKGSRNKFTLSARELAESIGSLPHEWLLEIMHGCLMVQDVLKDGTVIERPPTFEERLRAATAAAPYYAPKMAAQTVVVSPTGSDPIEELMKAVQASPNNRAGPGI